MIGWPFVLAAVVLVLLLRARRLQAWRIEVLAVVGLAFAATTLDGVADAVCLAAMGGIGWLVLRGMARRPHRLWLPAGIAAALAVFVLSRQVLPRLELPPLAFPPISAGGGSLPSLPVIGHVFGLSYVMFRVLHLIVDAVGNEVPPLRKRDLLAYLVSFPTFLAGPIQRVQDFVEESQRRVSDTLPQALAAHGPLLARGFARVTLLAGAANALLAWSQTAPLPSAGALTLGALAFAAYLYAGFAGYTDLVRGIAGLGAFGLPENFDRPFAAPNFLEFWGRWHISLSDWFKLYVFNPAVKAMIARSPDPAWIPYLGAAGYFLTFFLMGLWHGLSVRFALYGLFLGGGVSVNKLFQVVLQRRLGRRDYAALARRSGYAVVARAAAGAFFIVALGFLWLPDWPAPVPAAAACVTIFALMLLIAILDRRVPEKIPSARAIAVIAGIQVAAGAAWLVLGGTIPPVLYAYF